MAPVFLCLFVLFFSHKSLSLLQSAMQISAFKVPRKPNLRVCSCQSRDKWRSHSKGNMVASMTMLVGIQCEKFIVCKIAEEIVGVASVSTC